MFSKIVVFIFLAYIVHSMWTLSQLFNGLSCTSEPCYQSLLEKNPKMQLALFTSVPSNPIASEVTKILNIENFNYLLPFQKVVELNIPRKTRRNGTLHLQVVLAFEGQELYWKTLKREGPSVIYTMSLTEYTTPKSEVFNLIVQNEPPTAKLQSASSYTASRQIAHLQTKVCVTMLTDAISLSHKDAPPELAHLIRINRYGEILPIIQKDFFNSRIENLVQINANTSKLNISLEYRPMGLGKLRLMLLIEHATKTLHTFGFSNKDLDDIKGIFSDTNLYLLCGTLIIGSVHLLFDFLSFKNDLIFWNRKQTYEGLSTRTTVWRAFSQIIIFLYLLDENTSLFVLIPSGIGTSIEIWKCKKILKLEINVRGIARKVTNKNWSAEKKTESFDREAMRYLCVFLYPLCLAGAVYSLLYQQQKSWYSWTLNSLVNGVYAFDFLFMLPQLFVNYKLKSVEALPWRSFMYKAFNTFIDDFFAFIITMPTAHRVACFRDDVVFLIYIFQRWLYSVDKSRIHSNSNDNQLKALPNKLQDKKNE